MSGINREGFAVFFEFVGEFKVELLALVIALIERREYVAPLRQVAGLFSGVTVGCGGRNTIILIDET